MRLFKINYNISFTLLLHVDNCLYKLLIYIQLQMRDFEKKKKRFQFCSRCPKSKKLKDLNISLFLSSDAV